MNKNYFAPGANYYDNHREITINNPGANSVDLLRAALAEDVTPESPSTDAPENGSKDIIPIPEEGKYSKVREYIKERSRYDEEFKNFVKEKSLRDLCARLTKEFGWYVDEHSLGSNLNRHRKD